MGKNGYGQFGRNEPAHRAVYRTMVGPIPDGLHIDHLCRNRRCVNPSHLEPVTQKVNSERGFFGSLTECHRGHPFDEINTYYRSDSGRNCRECARINGRARRARAAGR